MADGFLLDATSYDVKHLKDKNYIQRRIAGEESKEKNVDHEDVKEREMHQKRVKEKVTSLKMSDAKKQRIMDSFENTIVVDYGDLYHLTDKERVSKQKFYDMFRNVSKMRKKYSNLRNYVLAYREIMKCVRAVAEDAEKHNVMSADEFVSKALKRKITINGIIFPVYNGKNKKRIDWDQVTRYIMNPDLPVEDLPINYATRQPTIYDDLPDEYFMTEEEYHSIKNRDVNLISDNDLTWMDGRYHPKESSNIVLPMSDAEYKKLLSDNPDIVYIFKDIAKQRRSVANIKSGIHSYDEDVDDLYDIDEEMQDVLDADGDKIPKFKGDIMNSDDYDAYLAKLEHWEKKHTYIQKGNSKVSVNEYEESKFREMLDEHGYNVKHMYRDYEAEKREKDRKRQQRKKEDRLYKKLRRIKRENGDEGISKDEFTKQKSKKSDKKKKKKASYEKKAASENLKDRLDDLTGGDFEEFKDLVQTFNF